MFTSLVICCWLVERCPVYGYNSFGMVDMTQQTQQMMQGFADKLPSVHRGG